MIQSSVPDVSIIIVTHNSQGFIEALLDSIQPGLGPYTGESIVVDNGSSDATCDLVSRRDDCRLIRSDNVGYAGGFNRGASQARGSRAFILLNPDVRLMPRSVERMVQALRSPGTGIVAPLVRNADGTLFASLRREPSLPRSLGLNHTGIPWLAEYLTRSSEYVTPKSVAWALGAALAISPACYQALGGWDESYFLYSEETDFCLRAKDAGFDTRFEPSAEVIHHGGASGRNDKTHSMQILNRVRLYSRRHSTPAAYSYWALSILSELSWLARGHGQSRAAVRALVFPGRRPTELGLNDRLLPR